MRRYVHTKKTKTTPQPASIYHNSIRYTPTFLHATVDQSYPVGHNKTFRSHKHDFYHIVLYTKGQGEYSMEGTYYPAEPGTCVLVAPGLRHDFVSRWHNTVYSEITFVYDSPQSPPLCASFEKLLSIYTGLEISLEHHLHLSSDQRHLLQNLLTTTIRHLNSPHPLSQFNAQHDLSMIFNFLVTTALSASRNQFPLKPFEKAKEHIEKHCFDEISIEELARIAGVSKGYFFRQFKKQFDISPLAYQQAIRIEAAKTLLKTTTLGCKEIASQTGFSNVYFFHRIFKKHTATTPVQYRKKQQI
mgnify:CR=1 FL=1